MDIHPLKTNGASKITARTSWRETTFIPCFWTTNDPTRWKHIHCWKKRYAFIQFWWLTCKVPLSAILRISSPPQKAPLGTYRPWPWRDAAAERRAWTDGSERAVGEPTCESGITMMLTSERIKDICWLVMPHGVLQYCKTCLSLVQVMPSSHYPNQSSVKPTSKYESLSGNNPQWAESLTTK